MKNNSIELQKIPAIDKLLSNSKIKEIIENYGLQVVKYTIRTVVEQLRAKASMGEEIPQLEQIIARVEQGVKEIADPSLRSVINGSGIVLHTNLGRAPLGERLLLESAKVLEGYSNLEFDLKKGKRGLRDSHAERIIKFLTGAEDVVVVNNNAAAVFLILTALGKRKEAIVSRGELIEIGGSFRIPDIMKLSGCKMVEVGATNKTKPSDYTGAITPRTALLFKAHRSNYVIKGFTQELTLEELATIGTEHSIPTVYDIGSGLLRKVDSKALKDEPDVQEAISAGIDIVCFSGDKLLGAAQAGIIAGKKEYIAKIKRHPLMRALRVCKTTLAMLEKACSYYLDDKKLYANNRLFATLAQTDKELSDRGNRLIELLGAEGISATLSPSEGQYGGGTLPDLSLASYQVKIEIARTRGKELFHKLLTGDNPLLTNLKSGYIYIDMLTIEDRELHRVVDSVKEAINR